MGKFNWTKEQKQAIEEKNSNLLVAAAAGSGKTAVLVERMIQKILQDKIDIDRMLIVTFTNAAASEMREKILNAIYEKIEEKPEEEHLQRQLNLLSKASISTIHSFCLDVIRNHFYETKLSPNFRIGDSSEIELLKQETMEEVLEEGYEKEDEDLLFLLDAYANYRGDEPLQAVLFHLYEYIQSTPFPKKWLEEKVQMFDIRQEGDFSETIWGKELRKEWKKCIEETVVALRTVKEKLEESPELSKFSQSILLDIERLKEMQKAKTWKEMEQEANYFAFTKWPVDRKIVSNIKDEAKAMRDKIIKRWKDKKEKLFAFSSEQAMQSIQDCYDILKKIQKYVLTFLEAFSKKKLEKNLVDFHDIEHIALSLLQTEEGTPSAIAKSYQEKFEEIAIDEYQDSNLVQEAILTTISRGNNIFMVGDVKQSIYRFRQARPELFLEKYRTYREKAEQKEGENLKIKLFQNFRSRENILNVTNLLFQDIMSEEVGEINYNISEYLNLGAIFPEAEQEMQYAGKAEVLCIDTKEPEEGEEEKEKQIENALLEAKLVADRIEELMKSAYMVWDKKKGYRPVTYRDIVILLRATSQTAPVFEQELVERQIPVFSDTSSTYLDSIEVHTIISLLKVIDNPMQDIPLVTVMRSMIGGFSDNDLVQIRLADKQSLFYEAMLKARTQVDKVVSEKIEKFLTKLESWQKQKEYLPLDEFIWSLYMDTNYYHYVGLMPNGAFRKANLRMLFEKAKQYELTSFRGLYYFIQFIDKVKKSSGDMEAAKIIGENEDVVRIMSIHKSKGLEFPIVFLSGLGKQFNKKDLTDPILLDQDLGLGPNFIDVKYRIQYDTLAKIAIKNKMKKENLSEEMRILYVALTRAKEKLIMTGIQKDSEKKRKEIQNLLFLYPEEDKKLSPFIVEKANCYFDWIEMMYLHHEKKIAKEIEWKTYAKEELLKKWQQKDDEPEKKETLKQKLQKLKAHSLTEQKKEELDEKLKWEYPYAFDTKLPGKISVSEIKEMKQKEVEKIPETVLAKPKFAQETTITAMQRGTILHLCMQHLNLKEDSTAENIKEMVAGLVTHHFITEEEAKTVDVQKLYQFTQSKIAKELKQAQEIEKEKPFYTKIPAKVLYGEESTETILVQGIVDLFYRNKEGKIILVDYKTDYVEKGKEQELVEKYQEQFKLYKAAIEEAYSEKVEYMYLYSTYLGKELEVKE